MIYYQILPPLQPYIIHSITYNFLSPNEKQVHNILLHLANYAIISKTLPLEHFLLNSTLFSNFHNLVKFVNMWIFFKNLSDYTIFLKLTSKEKLNQILFGNVCFKCKA